MKWLIILALALLMAHLMKDDAKMDAAPQGSANVETIGGVAPLPAFPAVAAPLSHPLEWTATVEQGGKVRYYVPQQRERNF